MPSATSLELDSDVAIHHEITAVVALALLIVAVESALGDMTLMTYEQVKEEERCAMCQSEYGQDSELVPACGHFFHARCDVDRWLRKCPLCRGGLCPQPLPGLPRPECPPMPPRRPSD
nr:E3 ubiquitin-protein ligase EL5-like [Lolium perenne]